MKKFDLTILSVDEIEGLLVEDEEGVTNPPCDKYLDSTALNHGDEVWPMFVLSTNNKMPQDVTKVVCGHDDGESWYFWWTKMPSIA